MPAPRLYPNRRRRRIEDGDLRVVAGRIARWQRRSEIRDAAMRARREVHGISADGLVAYRVSPVRVRAHRIHRSAAVSRDTVQCHPRLAHRDHAGATGSNDAAAYGSRCQGRWCLVRRGRSRRCRVLTGDRSSREQRGDQKGDSRRPHRHRLNLPKSSGRRFSRYCLSCSALSSSAVFAASKSCSSPSSASSPSTDVSNDSSAKIGAESLSATAMLSDGLASIWTSTSPRMMCSSAKYVLFCTFVICTRRSCPPRPTMRFLQRSCVSGRSRLMLLMCIAIDSASGCPIQMGSSREPPFSWRITTYELVELSSPRRATVTSTINGSCEG